MQDLKFSANEDIPIAVYQHILISFLFINFDPFICKQVGHFIFETSGRRNLLLAHTV